MTAFRLFLLLVMLPSSALAQVYNCQGTFSSKPCEGAAEIRFQRDVSRVSAPRLNQPTFDDQRAALNNTGPVEDKPCAAVPGGVWLRFSKVDLVEVDGGYVKVLRAIFDIRNASKQDLLSEVSVIATPSDGSPPSTISLGTTILGLRSASQSMEIQRTSGNDEFARSFNFELKYAPAEKCESVVVYTSTARTKSRNSYAGGDASQTFDNSTTDLARKASSELDQLEKDLVKAEQRRRGSNHDFDNSPIAAEALNLQNLINSTCFKIYASARSGNARSTLSSPFKRCAQLTARATRLGLHH